MKPGKHSTSINYKLESGSVPPEVLRDLYHTMLRIQKTEEAIASLYHDDEMKTPIHLCLGQEAVSAGVCLHLKATDYVSSNHRSHGHYLAKGGNLKAMIAELYNRVTGCSAGRGGSMHLVDTSVGLLGSSSIVGGGIPIATGIALGSMLRKNRRVAIAFFGDAAVEEGVIYESINFAVLKKLPVIYVCENNFYSVFTPLHKRQAKDDIYRRFEGLSIPGYRVDGNNVIEVYATARKAIENARSGGGPAFIEARTYRLTDHHGTKSGVEVGYRTQEEIDEWSARCPVKNYADFLLSQRIMTATEQEEMANIIDREIAEAFEFAQVSPLPDVSTVNAYLF
ncbi:thiamine pyrophosphate-dependent dehydrogenase E1 component subunit alpha [Chloroflexota bacterium]